MKKYSIGFILIEIAVMLVISCIPTIFVFLYTDPEKNLTIPAFIVFLFLAFILHTGLANRILFPIAKKTMENRSENIGINKLECLLRSPRCPFVLYVGKKKLVKRKEFEKFISDNIEI